MSLLGRLLKRPAETAAPADPAATATPAYYEVWGGLESANRALWLAVWFSTVVALLCLIMVRALLCRPPLVIRVTDSGLAQVMPDDARQPPVSEAEIKNFLSLFERFFFGLTVHTYDADLKLAFSMMSPAFQGKANDLLKHDGTIEALKANEGRVRVNLTELKILRDTPEVLECRVMGNRQIGSFKIGGSAGQIVFEHVVILRKVPRSDKAPYGVLVDDFHESIYENTLPKN